jgi:hypothetical protein
MNSQQGYFFSATQSVSDEMGDMFSFTWSAYLGMRELWWQARGYAAVHPEIPAKAVEKKFTGGLPLPGGIDFKQMFLESAWEEHEKRIAKSILFEACTMYEGWLEEVCSQIMLDPKEGRKLADQLQFPAGRKNNKGQLSNFETAIASTKLTSSNIIKSQVYPGLRANKLNCWADFNDYLIAYRYFKEWRNSFIHSKGKVNDLIIENHALLSHVESITKIPFAPSFNHPFSLLLPKKDAPIPINLQDCKLFATLVLKMIVTLDAELAVHANCEHLLKERAVTHVGSQRSKWRNLAGQISQKRDRAVLALVRSLGLPPVQDVQKFDGWLMAQKIV